MRPRSASLSRTWLVTARMPHTVVATVLVDEVASDLPEIASR
jgi:hypothetical protein